MPPRHPSWASLSESFGEAFPVRVLTTGFAHTSVPWMMFAADMFRTFRPIALPLRAMTYCQALRWLRRYLQLPWLSQPLALPELNFTAHSMKATLLSWALQVPGIAEADRLRQGHHRRGSAELYSRDDVLGQLRTQSAVRDAIRSGAHFSIPLHRGGQRPIQPIQVPNETFCKAASEQPLGFL